jgi:hypothetical protein
MNHQTAKSTQNRTSKIPLFFTARLQNLPRSLQNFSSVKKPQSPGPMTRQTPISQLAASITPDAS